MRKILTVIAFLLLSNYTTTPVVAQGCGPHNPNCIVPTAPVGTCNNQAASTAFVCQNSGGGGGGAVSSVANTDGTLTVAPTTGAVIASINLNNANTWTATQADSVSFRSPLIVGGTAANSTLTLESTSGAGTTDFISFKTASQQEGWRIDSGQHLLGVAPNGNPATGINTFHLQIGHGSGNYPGIGILDTGAIGLWSSGLGTFLNIGFAANSSTGLTTIGQFSNLSGVNNSALTVTPPASSMALGLHVAQTLAGSGTLNNCNNCISLVTAANLIDISSDNVPADISSGNTNGIIALGISMKYGGAAMKGERAAFYTSQQLVAADPANSFCPCSVGMVNEVISAINDGGTGTGPGQGRGQLFAWNPRVQLRTGGTNWDQVAIAEMDLEVRAGASVGDKYGLLFVLQPLDAVQGSRRDFAYGIGNAGSVGWRMGFIATDIFGFPFSTNATFIGTDFQNPVSHTIQTGIDLTGFTINGDMIVGGSNAGQPTFAVSGTGDIVGQSYNIISGGVLTNGANCTVTTPAHLTVVHGIVTLCN